MEEKGVTLLELMVAISIIGILLVGLGMSLEGWIARYRIEKTARELYFDLMKARVMAIQKNIGHYAVLGDYTYSVVEDTDENGLQSGGDKTLSPFPKTVDYKIQRNGSGNRIIFGTDGMISSLRTLWFTSNSGADYDCMKVSQSRVIMGRYAGGECAEK